MRDLIQAGWIALYNAQRLYDPEIGVKTGAKFGTYAYRYVQCELQKYIAKNIKYNMQYKQYDAQSVTQMQRTFIVPEERNEIANVDRKDLVRHMLDGLSERELDIIRLYYIEELPIREIASIMSDSYPRIRGEIRDISRKMARKAGANEDYSDSRMQEM